jgi:hypothetical protein
MISFKRGSKNLYTFLLSFFNFKFLVEVPKSQTVCNRKYLAAETPVNPAALWVPKI